MATYCYQGTAIDYHLNKNLSDYFSTLVFILAWENLGWCDNPGNFTEDLNIARLAPPVPSPNLSNSVQSMPPQVHFALLGLCFHWAPVFTRPWLFEPLHTGWMLLSAFAAPSHLREGESLHRRNGPNGGKFSQGVFFLQQPYTCWWPSPPCCLYVRIPSAGQSGSLGVRRGF